MPLLVAISVVIGGSFYCGSIITGLNGRLKTLKDVSDVETLLVESKLNAEKDMRKKDGDVSDVKALLVESKLNAEKDMRMKDRNVWESKLESVERNLQAEKDMRMKDKELAENKIQNITFLGGIFTVLGGTLLLALFLGKR